MRYGLILERAEHKVPQGVDWEIVLVWHLEPLALFEGHGLVDAEQHALADHCVFFGARESLGSTAQIQDALDRATPVRLIG